MTSPLLPSNPSSSESDAAVKLESPCWAERGMRFINCPPWSWSKSQVEEQNYSLNLLQAVCQVWQGGGDSSSPKQVQETAYRVLAATTAKGRTRWSHGILTNRLRLKLKYMKKIRRQSSRAIRGGNSGAEKKPKVKITRLKSRYFLAFQRKLRFLRRLVPGCRKQPLPVVVEEATDYIAALEMQVRAMRSLAELLSVSGSGPATSATVAPALPASSLKPPC